MVPCANKIDGLPIATACGKIEIYRHTSEYGDGCAQPNCSASSHTLRSSFYPLKAHLMKEAL